MPSRKLPTADVSPHSPNTFPIWVALLSWPLYGHLPGRNMLIAILDGIAGVALVEQPHLWNRAISVWCLPLAAAGLTAVAMPRIALARRPGPSSNCAAHFSSVATVFCLTAFVIGPCDHPITKGSRGRAYFLKLLAMGLTALIGQFVSHSGFLGWSAAKGIGHRF